MIYGKFCGWTVELVVLFQKIQSTRVSQTLSKEKRETSTYGTSVIMQCGSSTRVTMLATHTCGSLGCTSAGGVFFDGVKTVCVSRCESLQHAVMEGE